PTVRVRLAVTGPARAGFDEMLELHRLVCGGQASQTLRTVDAALAEETLSQRLPESLARVFLATLAQTRAEPELLTHIVRQAGPMDAETADWMFSENGPSKSTSFRLILMLLAQGFSRDPPRKVARRAEDGIYERDGWCCQAPGCSSRQHLEAHHIRYRSHGGDDDDANRLTLCRFHHQRGEHGGLLSVTGLAPLEVTFVLGRNGRGGTYRNEKRLS
ncbi:MAG: HNH endonuclease, partial [Acidobacteriota bacterium]